MNSNKDQKDQFLLSFSDILSLFRQSKLTIFCWALACGLLGAYFGLIKPIRYQAEGTFREKGIKPSGASSSSVLQLLGGGNLIGGESEATSLMTSHKMLKDVIGDLHLQSHLEAVSEIETQTKLIKRNFMLAWASLFSSSPKPVLKDLSCPIQIQHLSYTGEIPLSFFLNLQEDGRYEVLDLAHSEQSIGWGKLGEPFQIKQLSLTLVLSDSIQPIKAQSFSLSINSLANTVKGLCHVLKVESSKLDKSLLILKCEHRNRFMASAIINAVMNCYQNYLKHYHEDLAMSQLDYLSQRRDQLTKNLTHLMQGHADYLAKDLYSSGFIDTEKEMEFLAKNQYEYKRKLLDNELEIKRLLHIEPTNLAYYERYTPSDTGNSTIINSILAEMRILKHRRDSLEIELQKKVRKQGSNLQHSFNQQIEELKELQQYLAEVQEIAHQYKQGDLPDSHFKILHDPRFFLKGWLEHLQNAQQAYLNDWKEVGENFKFYLNNLERLFGVHERILQERLTHQQNPSEEYQGISLEVATSLYLDYSKKSVEQEGIIRKNVFFIKQIEDPHFEISSLSSELNDPVSASITQKASQLVLNLRDENNQSLREQERIKNELNLQRIFLTMHLKQMVQLRELHQQLIDEKIAVLQNVSLELIHQRISLLENNLQDYLKSRRDNLQQEEHLIKRHLENIHAQMAFLPQKWVSEKLVNQEVETNRRIVEEIIKLVESKNISHKLEVVQSAPVDLSIPPVHPLLPKVVVFGLIGFFLGGLMGSGMILGKTLTKGFKVSAENLNLMGYHVSGRLTAPLYSSSTKQLKRVNLDTLRRLQAYFDPPSFIGDDSSLSGIQEAKTLLLIEGKGVDYATDLADVFMKRGRRILMLDLTDTQVDSKPGLLQYLEGTLSTPPIQKRAYGDYMASGGASYSMLERISSPVFKQFIDQVKIHYDWILVVSRALPCSVEAETLLSLFYNAAMTLKEETTTDLNLFNHFLRNTSPYKLTFILNHSK